jgi:hypothetical protein
MFLQAHNQGWSSNFAVFFTIKEIRPFSSMPTTGKDKMQSTPAQCESASIRKSSLDKHRRAPSAWMMLLNALEIPWQDSNALTGSNACIQSSLQEFVLWVVISK